MWHSGPRLMSCNTEVFSLSLACGEKLTVGRTSFGHIYKRFVSLAMLLNFFLLVVQPEIVVMIQDKIWVKKLEITVQNRIITFPIFNILFSSLWADYW